MANAWNSASVADVATLDPKQDRQEETATASGTQGRLRGALTSQEIAKYIEHCIKPGKAPGPDK